MSDEKQKSDFRAGEYSGRYGGIFSQTPDTQAGRDGYTAGVILRQQDTLRKEKQEAARDALEAEERLEHARRLQESARLAEERWAEEQEIEEERRLEGQAVKQRWRDATTRDPGVLAQKISLGIASRIDQDAYWFAKRELIGHASKPSGSSFVRECIYQLSLLPDVADGDRPVAPREVFELARELASIRTQLLLEGRVLCFQNNARDVEEVEQLWDWSAEQYDFLEIAPEMRAEKWVEVEEWMHMDAPFLEISGADNWRGKGHFYLCDTGEMVRRRSLFSGDEYWIGRVNGLAGAIEQCDAIGLWDVNPRWLKWVEWEGDVQESIGHVPGILRFPTVAVAFIMSHRQFLMRAMTNGAATAWNAISCATESDINSFVETGLAHSTLSTWLSTSSLEPVEVARCSATDSWIQHEDSQNEDFASATGLYAQLRDLMESCADGVRSRTGGDTVDARISNVLRVTAVRWQELCNPGRADGPMCAQVRAKASAILARLKVFDAASDEPTAAQVIVNGSLAGGVMVWFFTKSFLLSLLGGPCIALLLLPVVMHLKKRRARGGDRTHHRFAIGLLDRWSSRV